MHKKKTIAVDFDGVLHAYTSPWTKPEEIADSPTPGALAFLRAAVERFDVAIFSVRAQDESGTRAIASWLARHGLAPEVIVQLRITAEKPKAVVYLDDRAWCFAGEFPTLDAIDGFVPWNRKSGKMPAPSPALSRVLSPAEARGLWLTLYAASLARGGGSANAVEFANRGTGALDDLVDVGLDTLPEWLRQSRTCATCGGTGWLPAPESVPRLTVDCPACGGSGKA